MNIDPPGPYGPQNTPLESSDAKDQQNLFQELSGYTLTDKQVPNCHYFKLTSIDGIDYYAPSDEDWGSIVAVSHSQKMAVDTGFAPREIGEIENPSNRFRILFDGVKLSMMKEGV